MHPTKTPVVILLLAVFKGHHAGRKVHYHMASSADRQYRFCAATSAMLHKSGLATHWSTTRDHYVSDSSYVMCLRSPTPWASVTWWTPFVLHVELSYRYFEYAHVTQIMNICIVMMFIVFVVCVLKISILPYWLTCLCTPTSYQLRFHI